MASRNRQAYTRGCPVLRSEWSESSHIARSESFNQLSAKWSHFSYAFLHGRRFYPFSLSCIYSNTNLPLVWWQAHRIILTTTWNSARSPRGGGAVFCFGHPLLLLQRDLKMAMRRHQLDPLFMFLNESSCSSTNRARYSRSVIAIFARCTLFKF
jgi:hypothetical protein